MQAANMDQGLLLPTAPMALTPSVPTGFFSGHGFVIHGFGFQFSDGTRTGSVLEDDLTWVDLMDPIRMPHRATSWHALALGEFPIAINGFSSTIGFLAYCIEVVTTQKTFPPLCGTETPCRGGPFNFRAPAGFFIKDVRWYRGSPTHVLLASMPPLTLGSVAPPDIGWVDWRTYGFFN